MDAAAQLAAALADRYEIDREIGRGGMATVYLARDVKHDRRVAVKVLHPDLAAALGADRFLAEIRTTANLQHPHILPLHDSGEAEGFLFYVMPFVEGESLRHRLERERQLPIEHAVRIATETLGALDYAHRHGVIHRDVKPENILLHDGSALVADFGIALAVTAAASSRMTQTGLSLGTPQYMSPEQAMGEKHIDGRADVYAVGAVLYEMLVGEPPFTGSTVQAIVAKVMTERPMRATAVRTSIPSNVEAAIERSLGKVPADRFDTATQFAEALANPSFSTGANRAADDVVARSVLWWRRTARGTAVLLVGVVAVALWGWLRPAPPKQVVRYTLDFDSTEALSPLAGWGRIALSPDGSTLVYVSGPTNQLMLRARNALHAKPIPGTEGASTPFFSPNGDRVGFVTTGHVLRIVALDGSPPIVVTDSLVGPAGFSWGRDGFIYGDGSGQVPLVRVAAKAGAVPAWFTVLDTASGETDEIFPDVLPNGKAVLFTATLLSRGGQTHNAIELADVATGAHHVLIDDAYFARYCGSGHLLYVTSTGTLMVAPFDLAAQKITGDPVVVAEGVRHGPAGIDIAVSRSGTLMYIGGGSAAEREMVWVTRDGKSHEVDTTWRGAFSSPSLSPDGTRLAVAIIGDDFSANIWIKQLDAGPAAKLTVDGGMNLDPGWGPDGRSVSYTSQTPTGTAILLKPADGSARAVTELRMHTPIEGAHQSPDGRWLVFQKRLGPDADIVGIRVGVDSAPVPLVATKYCEEAPALSPDGRWMSYTSNETGRSEVYVVPFPNTSASKWLVSSRGGHEPTWSHRGTELFYRDADGFLVSVSVVTKPTFSVGRATPLFSARDYVSAQEVVPTPQYAVSADDKRFLFIRAAPGQDRGQLTVVENWFDELKARK